LPYLWGPRTLEIGFGTGHLQVGLHQKRLTVFGLDESAQMAKIAFRRIKARGLHPCLARGFAQNLPYADESFHQVVMTFPAEFILNPQTIDEIRRVLVKGGAALIVPFAWITGRNPLQRILAWLFRITGEAPEWDEKYLEPLRHMGFEISWKMIEFAASKVLLVQLEKPLDSVVF
jgi:ubiquinone/menaquinone biosynthesis C-methylase UbiE